MPVTMSMMLASWYPSVTLFQNELSIYFHSKCRRFLVWTCILLSCFVTTVPKTIFSTISLISTCYLKYNFSFCCAESAINPQSINKSVTTANASSKPRTKIYFSRRFCQITFIWFLVIAADYYVLSCVFLVNAVALCSADTGLNLCQICGSV